jgi:hypothetical protein
MTSFKEENNAETKASFSNVLAEKAKSKKVHQVKELNTKSQRIILKMDFVQRDLLFTVKIRKSLKDIAINY